MSEAALGRSHHVIVATMSKPHPVSCNQGHEHSLEPQAFGHMAIGAWGGTRGPSNGTRCCSGAELGRQFLGWHRHHQMG